MSSTLILPLLAHNALNVLLHPLGALPAHLVRHMAVHIKGKGSGGVAQIPLHRLDVIPGLDCGHRIAVAQIMKADGGEPMSVTMRLKLWQMVWGIK